MNRKYLEIWLRYRERKYIRDLDELQNNFAARGLTSSIDVRITKLTQFCSNAAYLLHFSRLARQPISTKLNSMREKAEQWLGEDYEDDVAMEKEESVVYENEKDSQNNEQENSIRTNRILASVAVISPLLSQ